MLAQASSTPRARSLPFAAVAPVTHRTVPDRMLDNPYGAGRGNTAVAVRARSSVKCAALQAAWRRPIAMSKPQRS